MGGPSRMRAKNLQEWLQDHWETDAAKEAEAEGETSEPEGRERDTEEMMEYGGEGREPKKWEMVMELVQMELRGRLLADEAAWQAVVLILKGGEDYRGIGVVEVIWKAVAVILNRRFTASIKYHDSLHGFQAGHGTGNAKLKVNLLQQVAALRETVLHVIFLDLYKV